MRPTLAQRLGLVDVSVERRADPALMARSLLYLFAVGGTIAIASLVAVGERDLPRAATSAVCAWGAVAILLTGYDSLPRWVVHLFLAGGAGLVDDPSPRNFIVFTS